MIKLADILPNPKNPRIIKDDKFKKLVKSIKDFPKMMELRPMVVDENMNVLGGNMRLKALKELGYKEVPDSWIKAANELTPEEIKQFIIVDNIGYGEWDWDTLANEWDAEQLTDWGLEIPDFGEKIESVEGEDDIPVSNALSVAGDIWELNNHRVMCGSSCNTDDNYLAIRNTKKWKQEVEV